MNCILRELIGTIQCPVAIPSSKIDDILRLIGERRAEKRVLELRIEDQH